MSECLRKLSENRAICSLRAEHTFFDEIQSDRPAVRVTRKIQQNYMNWSRGTEESWLWRWSANSANFRWNGSHWALQMAQSVCALNFSSTYSGTLSEENVLKPWWSNPIQKRRGKPSSRALPGIFRRGFQTFNKFGAAFGQMLVEKLERIQPCVVFMWMLRNKNLTTQRNVYIIKPPTYTGTELFSFHLKSLIHDSSTKPYKIDCVRAALLLKSKFCVKAIDTKIYCHVLYLC